LLNITTLLLEMEVGSEESEEGMEFLKLDPSK
jgi:hypothetical protein